MSSPANILLQLPDNEAGAPRRGKRPSIGKGVIEDGDATNSERETEPEPHNQAPTGDQLKLWQFKRAKAIEELLDTEKNFLKDMSDVYHGYEEAIPRHVLSWDEKCTIFRNLKELVSLHTGLLQNLEKVAATDDSASIARCFQETKFVDVYETFFSTHDRAVLTLKNRKSDPALQACLLSCQKQLNHKLGLTDYLIKPVQRIFKYHLLLKEQLKYITAEDPIRKGIEAALEHMYTVANELNAIKRQRELEAIMHGQAQVFADEDSSLGPLLEEIEVKIVGGKSRGSTRHLYLFTNAFLVCKPRPDGSIAVKEAHPLRSCVVELVSDHSFSIGDASTVDGPVVYHNSMLDAGQWVSRIKTVATTSQSPSILITPPAGRRFSAARLLPTRHKRFERQTGSNDSLVQAMAMASTSPPNSESSLWRATVQGAGHTQFSPSPVVGSSDHDSEQEQSRLNSPANFNTFLQGVDSTDTTADRALLSASKDCDSNATTPDVLQRSLGSLSDSFTGSRLRRASSASMLFPMSSEGMARRTSSPHVLSDGGKSDSEDNPVARRPPVSHTASDFLSKNFKDLEFPARSQSLTAESSPNVSVVEPVDHGAQASLRADIEPAVSIMGNFAKTDSDGFSRADPNDDVIVTLEKDAGETSTDAVYAADDSLAAGEAPAQGTVPSADPVSTIAEGGHADTAYVGKGENNASVAGSETGLVVEEPGAPSEAAVEGEAAAQQAPSNNEQQNSPKDTTESSNAIAIASVDGTEPIPTSPCHEARVSIIIHEVSDVQPPQFSKLLINPELPEEEEEEDANTLANPATTAEGATATVAAVGDASESNEATMDTATMDLDSAAAGVAQPVGSPVAECAPVVDDCSAVDSATAAVQSAALTASDDNEPIAATENTQPTSTESAAEGLVADQGTPPRVATPAAIVAETDPQGDAQPSLATGAGQEPPSPSPSALMEPMAMVATPQTPVELAQLTPSIKIDQSPDDSSPLISSTPLSSNISPEHLPGSVSPDILQNIAVHEVQSALTLRKAAIVDYFQQQPAVEVQPGQSSPARRNINTHVSLEAYLLLSLKGCELPTVQLDVYSICGPLQYLTSLRKVFSPCWMHASTKTKTITVCKDPTQKAIIRSIDWRSVMRAVPHPGDAQFYIVQSDRTQVFRATDVDTMRAWVTAINAVIP